MKMLLWALLGMAFYALPANTGNSVIADSPGKPTGPGLTGWRNRDDRIMAQSLEGELQRRIEEDSANLSYDREQLNGASEKRRSEYLQKIAEIKEILELLRDSFDELKKMGSSNTIFTFEYTREGALGYTCRESDNAIVIHFLNDINAIHELVHAWQIYRGKIRVIGCQREGDSSIEQYCEPEVIAYRRQFALDSASLRINVKSYMGEVRKLSDITNDWLLGLQDKDDKFIFWDAIQLFYRVGNQEDWKKYLKSNHHPPAIPQ